MVSDLRSGLGMMMSQQRPNVHLMGNPTVLAEIFNSHFLPERIMVNVLLHQRCEARINLRRKLGRGVVMQTLLKTLLTPK